MSVPPDDNDADDYPSDAASESSSVVYGHEPFETFRTRVLNLALDLWEGSTKNQINIERLPGGAYNRIIAISKAAPGISEEYILRIPRFDAAKLDRDVAALYYVQKLRGIPIPQVVSYDETSDNRLGSPYMIQKRLPGESLHDTFPTMDQDSKYQIATDLGYVYHQMLSARSEVAGLFSLSPKHSSSDHNASHVFIAPLFETDADLEVDEPHLDRFLPAHARLTSSTLEVLETVFSARKADGKKRIPNDSLRPRLWDRFIAMAVEMDNQGWFQEATFALCHLDLAPRNILVDQRRGARITGILDWDSAVMAPDFMTCAPPMWIWAWNDDEDEDERTANDTPTTEEGKALKKAFEDAAGMQYLRYAYAPAYRLARRLVQFAIHGIQSSEDVKEAEAMLKEWEEVRQAPGDPVEIKEGDLPYLVIRTLGHGADSIVEEVRDRNSGLLYARKRFTLRGYKSTERTMREVFEHETRMLTLLKKHRHIVDLVASYTAGRELWLVMSPVPDEGNLRDFLHELSECRAHPIQQSRRIAAMSQIVKHAFGCLALGLKYLYEKGVRHSDVKPRNILVHQGQILYTDFGVSHYFGIPENDIEYGRSPMTRRYAAPEVLTDVSRSSSSDVFSLGCVFIEMVAALGMTIESIEFGHDRSTKTYAEYMKNIHEQLLVKRPSIGSFLPGVIIMMTLPDPQARWTAERVFQACLVQSGFTCEECAKHESEKDHTPFNPWQDCMDVRYLTAVVDGL